MQFILLAVIRGYRRYTPMNVRRFLSTNGTSDLAYEAISNGAGIGTFIIYALPLGWIYGGQGDW